MKNRMFLISLLSIVMVTSTFAVDLQKLDETINKAIANSWKEMRDDNWCFPTYLGTWFVAEYYFEIKALNLKNSKFNETEFTKLLLDTQLPDGSWEQVHEQNLKEGKLDPTIFNYWYLKSVGIDPNSEMMIKARDFVIAKGGIEKSQRMTQLKLAVFGHFPWTKLWYIPLFIFKKWGLWSYTYMKDITA